MTLSLQSLLNTFSKAGILISGDRHGCLKPAIPDNIWRQFEAREADFNIYDIPSGCIGPLKEKIKLTLQGDRDLRRRNFRERLIKEMDNWNSSKEET